jgi:hypothetical protein
MNEGKTPWYRIGMVWLVLGGPATVVVAGIVTAVIAYRGADPVVTSADAGVPAKVSATSSAR